MEGRGYVTPHDVKSIGMDVLRHRVIVSYEAEAEDQTAESVVESIFAVDMLGNGDWLARGCGRANCTRAGDPWGPADFLAMFARHADAARDRIAALSAAAAPG